jgi:hypothetical protein
VTTQTITFPAPVALINANHRSHWAAKAARTRTWRWTACIKARGLKPVEGKAHIVITISFTDRRRRDVGNLQPTAKAIVDGIVDAGVLPDDSDRYLIGPDMRAGEPVKGPVPVITVTIETEAS